MRTAVNASLCRSAAAALPLLWSAAGAAADDGELAREPGRLAADRWIPSLAATSGITTQTWTGAVASQVCRGCSIPDPLAREVPLRPSVTGDDRDVTPFVGGDFELMTPELPLPLSPRFFVGGGFLGSFGIERTVATEGNPGALKSPLPQGTGSTIPFSEDAVLGQGSETTAQLDSFIYGARAGVALPLELFGRSLRIKPSIGWIRYDVEAEGLVSDAECRSAPPPPAGNTNCNPQVTPPGTQRSIELRGSTSESFDGVGGGLDIEMDARWDGPLGWSLFAGAHAYHVLGDRTMKFGETASFPDTGLPGLGADATAARFRFEIDDVIFRVGVGLRIHWLGSSGAP